MEVSLSGGYNYSLAFSSLSYKHNYGSSIFFGKASASGQFGGGDYKGSMLLLADYMAGMSFLRAVNENIGLIPLDFSVSGGVGCGWESWSYSGIYENVSSSDNKFIYAIKGEIELEYIISQRIGILLNCGIIYPLNTNQKNPLLSYLGAGISFKF